MSGAQQASQSAAHAERHPDDDWSFRDEFQRHVDEDRARREAEAATLIAHARTALDAALAAQINDPGAILEREAIEAARMIREHNVADFSRLRAHVKSHKNVSVTEWDKAVMGGGKRDDSVVQSTATELVRIAREGCSLARDQNNDGVAIIECGTHRQSWLVSSRGYAQWLSAKYYAETHQVVGEPALKAAISTLEAFAAFEGAAIWTWRRVGRDGDDYYLDLCDDAWRSIKINHAGWRVVPAAPVYFLRGTSMLPLPEPIRAEANALDQLWKIANITSRGDRLLALAYLLEALRPHTPKPVLELRGDQGAAKSTTQVALRSLLDPNKSMARARPKNAEDIFVSAGNAWVLSYENLSHLSPDQQDAMCSVSTGAGNATRQFYTNGDEHCIEVLRPIMLNGITAVATRADLIDRTISIALPAITETARRTASDVKNEWDRDRPVVLGSLLDLFAKTLAILPTVTLTRKPRMADFALLGEAMARARGERPGVFEKIYAEARARGVDRAIAANPVADALDEYVGTSTGQVFVGTNGALLSNLRAQTEAGPAGLFKMTPRGLREELERLRSVYAQRGITISFDDSRTNEGRLVRICVAPKGTTAASQPSQPSQPSQATAVSVTK